MPSLRPTKNLTPTPAYLGKSPSIDLGTVGLYFGMSYSTATEWRRAVCGVYMLTPVKGVATEWLHRTHGCTRTTRQQRERQ